MADTQRTVAGVLALLGDNVTRDISPQDLRDALVTWRKGYGQIHVLADNAAVVSITDDTNYFEATAPVWTFPTSNAYLFDESGGNGRLTYTGAVPVLCWVLCSVSLSSGSNNQILRLRLGKNTDTLPESEAVHKVSSSGDAESTAVSMIAILSPGDYVSLWIRNQTDDNDVTVAAANLQALAFPQ